MFCTVVLLYKAATVLYFQRNASEKALKNLMVVFLTIVQTNFCPPFSETYSASFPHKFPDSNVFKARST